MKFTFTIKGRLPGLNEIINQARTHWGNGAKQKKEMDAICISYIAIGKVPVFTGPVTLSFHWIEPHFKRDCGNITAGEKFISDALVATGRIKNDSRKWVKGIFHYFPEPDKENPRVLVTIETVGEE